MVRSKVVGEAVDLKELRNPVKLRLINQFQFKRPQGARMATYIKIHVQLTENV
jgi:uncharacterized protein YpiB (UPF0302 family)